MQKQEAANLLIRVARSELLQHKLVQLLNGVRSPVVEIAACKLIAALSSTEGIALDLGTEEDICDSLVAKIKAKSTAMVEGAMMCVPMMLLSVNKVYTVHITKENCGNTQAV